MPCPHINDIQPGKSFKLFYGPHNPNNRILHIRGIIDHDYYVFRVYSNRKGWRYYVEHVSFFTIIIKAGVLYKRG